MADDPNDEGEDSEFNIARRTRSHLRIEDFVTDENLDQFPDVDMNLYQNNDSENDTEYKKFLQQTYSREIGADTNTDDNDPEYVYNDDIFSHGWRFDLNEVSELQQDDTESIKNFPLPGPSSDPQTTSEPTFPAISMSSDFKSPSKIGRRRIDMFDDPEFARVLNQQLRQHIQLLTQTYLLTKTTNNMVDEAEEAKSHLMSYIKIFKHKKKPSNLIPAMNIVNSLVLPKELQSSIRLSWRLPKIPESVDKIIQENPNVFMYPSLLPKHPFVKLFAVPGAKKPKVNFTLTEDNLLAYALNEFKNESSQYAFIASLLMTAKTRIQICDHIKNIKRSPDEKNPIKLYFSQGQLPIIDLDSDSRVGLPVSSWPRNKVVKMDTCSEQGDEPKHMLDSDTIISEAPTESNNPLAVQNPGICQSADDVMNMDLDDLMAASTTISKQPNNNVNNNNSENNRNIKNLKLKKSILNLMSHKFILSPTMANHLIEDFLNSAKQKLSECSYICLLQLLTNLMSKHGQKDDIQTVVKVFNDIVNLLKSINAPTDLQEKIVLFLNLEQATACGCAMSYLHWMRFFEFMEHVKLYHEGDDALDKKLARLVDALQKDDPHKIRLATANLVNKHPLLKREFESLDLNGKPHPSLFISNEDFDDITESIAFYDELPPKKQSEVLSFEHFTSKVTPRELSYASQSCPCKCHKELVLDGQASQHCGECNLKFMKGRMYLVNKIKPILAEYVYTGKTGTLASIATHQNPVWTFDEDREILEFCRMKAEQNDEAVSFDASTFEELVASKRGGGDGTGGGSNKSAREIAERFNHLMEIYRDENSNALQ